MTRIQPVLNEAEASLVNQMAALTGTTGSHFYP